MTAWYVYRKAFGLDPTALLLDRDDTNTCSIATTRIRLDRTQPKPLNHVSRLFKKVERNSTRRAGLNIFAAPGTYTQGFAKQYRR